MCGSISALIFLGLKMTIDEYRRHEMKKTTTWNDVVDRFSTLCKSRSEFVFAVLIDISKPMWLTLLRSCALPFSHSLVSFPFAKSHFNWMLQFAAFYRHSFCVSLIVRWPLLCFHFHQLRWGENMIMLPFFCFYIDCSMKFTKTTKRDI